MSIALADQKCIRKIIKSDILTPAGPLPAWGLELQPTLAPPLIHHSIKIKSFGKIYSDPQIRTTHLYCCQECSVYHDIPKFFPTPVDYQKVKVLQHLRS